ncbi:EscJ/YscJ/HrcJ family type III secretion inner membrane ring protein [Scandinavium sp. V105_16]|uniref:Lipoprotein n=1 Tax=Scandinavium lactucae TaxID=3095028 RepID=A0AAJ2S754_9ENTR|nr:MULTISPECIES: EscJ/YscJ/HrcJ family type III secretion inner membrane ring protein [unclassified Scandinavium]MDX6019553.1 EscJ/YscJ/HrcJ family type III secretion inner membrane ring protein [Scandinavium sp. V105_16]MDX6031008.1 EscJ/YscJ/HrcJ family type III secretion inner membrane ring protein [Scandinavium sp. V105_12]MDX6039883.1 EscJ/YscJ/HrcJ family type III secretion inner membrane ring protein [Scandinavium sp. V105_6]MDX6051886.1 EscJ/YscJ/HrcJ family type III secretion inner mem
MKKSYLFLPLTVLLLTGCKEEQLLKGLEQNQANEVIALLQRNNIMAAKISTAKEGFTVSVNARDFAAAVDLMTMYGLPRPPDIEIAQMFPADSLVSSPRAEKVRLYSGIEQRLAQSLLAIRGVVSSRVHVSYDIDAGEGNSRKKPIHLSALLNYDNQITDTSLLVGDVKRFLKNSFEDVEYDNISVILSKVNSVQRIAPAIASERSPSWMSWLFIVAMLAVSFVLIAVLMFKRKGHTLASALSKHSRLNGNKGQHKETGGEQAEVNPDVQSIGAVSEQKSSQAEGKENVR